MNRIARRWTVGLLSAALIVTGGAVTGTASAADALPTRILVGLKPGYDASARLTTLAKLGLQGAEEKGRARGKLLSEVRAKSLSVPDRQVQTALAALRRDPAVAYAELDVVRHASEVTANDPLYTQNLQPELSYLNVPAAWETTTGAAVTVAVVDTGVNAVGDLSGKVLPGFDFFNYDTDPRDDLGHGTMVSSLIAGTANNGVGLAGVCWQCKILPVKVLGGSDGSGSDSEIAQGIIYAVQNGAQIINMSLGGEYYTKTLADAVAYANARGVLVVAAAGNENTNAKSYPAALPDVLAVGGTDTTTGGTGRVYFSNYGSWVDVAAPGITAAMTNTGTYRSGTAAVKGTSFSSPLVAGVAALVKSAHPAYTGWSLQNAIKATATRNSWTQYGLVNAAKALGAGTEVKAPSLSYVSPIDNVRVHGTVAVIPKGVTDVGSGVQRVDLYVSGKWTSWSYTAPFAPKLNTAGKNGPISLRLKVTDKAGNVTWSRYRTLIADNVKPKVTLASARKNKAKVSGTVTITAKASDASGISKVQLLVNGKVVATDTTAGYTLKFKVKSQKKTMYVRLRAYDKAGNYTTTAVLRTYYRA